jgi:hypothetical protein
MVCHDGMRGYDRNILRLLYNGGDSYCACFPASWRTHSTFMMRTRTGEIRITKACAQEVEGGMRRAMTVLAHHNRKPKKSRRKGNVRSALSESWMFETAACLLSPEMYRDAPPSATEKKKNSCSIFSPITSIPETITLALSVPVHRVSHSRRTEDQEKRRPSS